MQFRILGALEVRSADQALPLGGAKPRRLLAALLISPDAGVSVSRLVAAVWGETPPPDAVNTVRVYVSRLRTTLVRAGRPDPIARLPNGYRLRLGEGELDAARFEVLLTRSRERSRLGDRHAALAALDEALALWRGPALDEFADLEFARAEAARLDLLRLAAAEDRVDALLGLGRGAETIADLEALVVRHPARERPHVQLMEALYADGRQADALAAYQRLRRHLADELGVDPSEGTQLVHRQILAHDPALAPAVAAPGQDTLPRAVTSFVGRVRETSTVVEVSREAPVVTLLGTGGVGKTRLAAEVAAGSRPRFPDGVWWAELAPLPPDGPVDHTVAAALRVQQRGGDSITRSVIEYLGSKRLLLVLDNCEHVLDGVARFVDAVVARCPQVAVLATSREPLGVAGERMWPVPPLPPAEAYALFVERARAVRPDFPTGGDGSSAVSEICRRLDGLPLAIELAAARTRVMSPQEVAHRLDAGQPLVGGRRAEPRHQSLHAAIDWSYHLLDEPERRFFDRLSAFAGGCDLAAAHAVCAEEGDPEERSLELLAGLVDKSMVVPDVSRPVTRYRLLETLRAFGQDRLRRDGDADATAQRHAEYFADLAERAAFGMRGPAEAHWVAETLPDYDNLRVAMDRVLDTRDIDRALRLAAALPEIALIRIGYESAQWAVRVLELAAGVAHPLLPMVHGAAARVAWNRADFRRARELAHSAGAARVVGPSRTAHPRDVLADVALYEGDVDAALRHYRDEVAIARLDDDPIRLVWTLYYVAVCHAVQRTPDRGRAAAGECLSTALHTANPTAVAMGRYALGLVLKKSEPHRALDLLDAGAEAAASVRNFWWYGVTAMEAAATRGVHADPLEAARSFLGVLDHWERVGDWSQQWLNLRYITRLLDRLGAGTDAALLHGTLLAAGRTSPLRGPRLAALRRGLGDERFRATVDEAADLAATDVVGAARAALRRQLGHPPVPAGAEHTGHRPG